MGVDPDPVRGIAKLPGARALFAPPSDDFAFQRRDGDALAAFGDMDDIVSVNEKVIG